jgi:hypothetical protein
MKHAFLAFASNQGGHLRHLNNDAPLTTIVRLHRLVPEDSAFQILGAAVAILSATSTRHVWEDPASLCSLPILRAVATGAMLILNALFTKLAKTITVFGAKLENA